MVTLIYEICFPSIIASMVKPKAYTNSSKHYSNGTVDYLQSQLFGSKVFITHFLALTNKKYSWKNYSCEIWEHFYEKNWKNNAKVSNFPHKVCISPNYIKINNFQNLFPQ